ncbi:ABC transporter permease [Dermatobacter hominis]|uniref:ABC transporter permease n=1 Tax=Dermatobacter hominis TaxID=2884263 RepID=UPI001D122D0D|nr:ABC transporter permease [Dermatobacter hominis]UDY35761.1 ABC transporter permease [Dermatobacter hominis]
MSLARTSSAKDQLRAAARTVGPALAIVAIQLVWFPMPSGGVLTGVVLGLLGSLAAIGLALVWRANRVINFAQGDLGAAPATLAVLLITLSGLPWLLGMTIGLAAAILVGLLADVLVIRRFFRSPRLIMTVATLGLSQILAFATLGLPLLWGEGPAIRSLPAPFEWSAEIGGVVFDANDLIAVVVAPLLLFAVAAVLRLTDTGIAVRASAERVERAAVLGIPVRRLEAQVWTLASVLSFCSVALTAGVASLPTGFGLGLTVLLRALAALVVGRMTHLVAITTTAVALGVLEAGIQWNTGETWLVSPFLAALIVVSLLLERKGTSRADSDQTSSWKTTGDVRPTPYRLARLPEVRLARWVGGLLLVAVALGVPQLIGTNGQLKAGVIVVFATIGTSIVVLTGWAGLVSLGQMAFVGAGGAVGAWIMVEQGWDPIVAMVVAGIVGAIVAVIVGLPALRLRGMYLAVTTLALSLAASDWIFSNKIADWIPRGSFPRPALFGRFELDSPLRIYYFALAVLALAVLALRGIRNSRTGRVLVALRDNEGGATAYGISTTRAKLTAFALSGAVAAIAGVVMVISQGAFRDVTYGPWESVDVFIATVIGGLGSLAGAVLGAVFQRGAQWLLPAPWSFLATGAGVLVVLLSMPDGLGGLAFRCRDRFLAWAARRHGVSSLAIDRTHQDDDVLRKAAASVAGHVAADADADEGPGPDDGSDDRTEPEVVG